MARILLTGAAGRVGTAITPLLREAGWSLRLLDLRQPAAATDGDEVVLASATDLPAMTAAARDVDLLVHLAGFAEERPLADLAAVNLESARVALEAARAAAVPVTVLASSGHAVGATPADEAGAALLPARPDSYYGVVKVAGEALAQLYADRFGMRVVSARIVAFDERPRTARALSVWLSPADLVRLLLAAPDARPGHTIVWGVSANTRGVVSLEAGRALGYEPQDDAEAYADLVAAELGYASGGDVPPLGSAPLGGDWADPAKPLGRRW
jgi:nucleoside-diphosphate-sugar epimerase